MRKTLMMLMVALLGFGCSAALLAKTRAPVPVAGPDMSPAHVKQQKQALAQALEQKKDWPLPIHDDSVFSKIMLDRLEQVDTGEGSQTYFGGQAWTGTDLNKLWLKGEVARTKGKTEDANVEAYYSRAIAAYWDVQAGVRHDFSTNGGPSRNWLGLGIQGLAPYKFDTEFTLYAGSQGRTAARLRGEYDVYLSQRLVFWPELELNFYGQDDPQRSLGTGLADSSLTFRLRYEIMREVAPYIGVQWVRKYAGTADYARQMSLPVSDTQYMIGVRIWW